jgi:hypothetical protein
MVQIGDYANQQRTAPAPIHHHTKTSTNDWPWADVRDERLATGGGTGGVSARIVAGAYDGNRGCTGATVGGGMTTGAMTGGEGAISSFDGTAGTVGTDALGFAAGTATTDRAVGAVVVAATGLVVTGPATSGVLGAPVTAATGDSDDAAGSAGQSHRVRKAGVRRNASSQNSVGI